MRFPALLIGRGGSRGVPGKNTMAMLGRPLMCYPILAARHSRLVDSVYLSTDDDEIKRIGREHGCALIDRPPKLATDSALVEDVVVHGYQQLARARGAEPEIFVLLFCNSATIRPGIIDEGIQCLIDDVSLDSAVTVSPYNEYSPVRAKKIGEEELLVPYLDVQSIPGASCDRDTAETAYFCDCSAWILRRRCTDLRHGVLPFRWMGQRAIPLRQEGGLDIDHWYGIAQTEAWLRRHGFSEEATPYDSCPPRVAPSVP